jgi:spore germination protein PE
MLKRTSKVNSLKVISARLNSVIQIGDSTRINGFARVIAIQRQKELFFTNEASFESYPFFSYPLSLPAIYEPITICSTSVNPLIKVGSIRIIGISSGSVVHIGSTEHFQAESRALHIRQIESKNNKNALKEKE